MTVIDNVRRIPIIAKGIGYSLGIAVLSVGTNILIGYYLQTNNYIVDYSYLKLGLIYIIFPLLWIFVSTLILRVLIIQSAYKRWVLPNMGKWLEEMLGKDQHMLSHTSQIISFIHLKIRERASAANLQWVEDSLYAHVSNIKWESLVKSTKLEDKALGKLESDIHYDMTKRLAIRKFPVISLFTLNVLALIYILF